ncbi:MAG: hypothetical protein LCI03_07585 [Actinobacteria bacterium]|jgi:hypothetical protein|nr:hypothetical protein [Actinomycetota bacterium]
MSKTPDEALARWREAEEAYLALAQPLFDGAAALDKDAAIEIEQARVKADKRLDTYLRKALKH